MVRCLSKKLIHFKILSQNLFFFYVDWKAKDIAEYTAQPRCPSWFTRRRKRLSSFTRIFWKSHVRVRSLRFSLCFYTAVYRAVFLQNSWIAGWFAGRLTSRFLDRTLPLFLPPVESVFHFRCLGMASPYIFQRLFVSILSFPSVLFSTFLNARFAELALSALNRVLGVRTPLPDLRSVRVRLYPSAVDRPEGIGV